VSAPSTFSSELVLPEQALASERSEFDASQVILVVTGFFSAYHHPIIESVIEIVAPLGFGVLCVTGQEIASDLSSDFIPPIFRNAARLNVVGTIILAGSLGHRAHHNNLLDFLDHFEHHQLVATDLPGQ